MTGDEGAGPAPIEDSLATITRHGLETNAPGEGVEAFGRESLFGAFERACQTMTRLEAIVSVFEDAIRSGALAAGTRLPTVRMLSSDLKVSPSTVLAAYNVLRSRGRIAGEVGRGTFVLGADAPAAEQQIVPVPRPRIAPWRRRTVAAAAARLSEAHPGALDCTRGKPDTTLIPTELIRRALENLPAAIDVEDLQYGDSEPLPELRDALTPRLRRDGIPTAGTELIVGNSAQQLMLLSVLAAARLRPEANRLIAVEEPGYQTVFDAFENAGFRLVGMSLDDHGVTPESFDAALGRGALVALFTPSALNPAGVSWTRRRRMELAEVLALHPQAMAIEDDHFADLASTRPGSLLDHKGAGDRTVYIRTFAKSIAPDLRVAVAVARPRLANQLAEMKSLWDGWTSRLSQRALANLLDDPDLDVALDRARDSYRARRHTIVGVLERRLAGHGASISGTDGLHVWIRLPYAESAASEIVERAALLGVLVTSGEPFHTRPGNNDVLRMSIGGISEDQAATAAERLADAILNSSRISASTIPV